MCILLDLALSSFLQIHKNPPFNCVIAQFWRRLNFIDRFSNMCNFTNFKSSILYLACQRSLILHAYISHIIFHRWNVFRMTVSMDLVTSLSSLPNSLMSELGYTNPFASVNISWVNNHLHLLSRV